MYTLYMWTVLIAATLFFGALLALSLLLPGRDRWYSLITHAWARTIVRLAGVKVAVAGLDKISPDRPYVFMSNHQSYFDVLVLIMMIENRLRFVAKRELIRVPVLGWLMWAAGHIFIARGVRANAVAGMKKAGEQVRSGTSILVFPEGTRSPDHKLGPFKKGGFILALEAQTPIVPVSISGTRPMMPKGKFSFHKSRAAIAFGDPVPTAGGPRDGHCLQALMDQVRAAIIQNFPDHSAEKKANQVPAG